MTKEQMIELKESYLSLALIMEEMIGLQEKEDNGEDISEEELTTLVGKFTIISMSIANLSL